MRRRNLIWRVIRLATLLACVAIVVALAWGWVASAGESREIYLSRDATPNASAMVFLSDGAMRVSHWWLNPQPRPARLFTKAFLGFGIHFERAVTPQGKTLMIQRFWVPIWFGIILFLLPPWLALWRGPMRRRRRHYEGLCLQCGYNLAGNISGFCMECGAICPPPADQTKRMRRRRVARAMVTGAFTLTALVMVAAWTVSYVKPLTKEWATEAYGKVVATMDGGALHLSASKLHEEYLGRSRGLPSKPSRWETAILGLAYSEYISEVELLASGGITPTLASIKAGQYVPSGPPKVKFETGWSLTLPVWIPFVLVIPPWLVLLYRPFRRRRAAGVVCT